MTPKKKSKSAPATKHVLSARFADFAESRANVLTFPAFLKSLGAEPKPADLTVLPGQGLHDDERMRLARWIAGSDGAVVGLPERASRTLAHKHEAKNTVVSKFRRTGAASFEGHVLIDDRCETLSDHQTGGHINGMTIKEAFRQAILVTSEQFHVVRGDSASRTVVLIRDDIEFLGFFWPLEARIEVEILEAELRDPERMPIRAALRLVQADKTVAQGESKYLILSKDRFRHHEARQAQAILEVLARKGGEAR